MGTNYNFTSTTNCNTPSENSRSVVRAMRLGAFFLCPSCGKGALFERYLKVSDTCSHCHEELHHHRADDAPPYFTIFIVGHIMVPLIIAVEMAWTPPLWLHALIFFPLTTLISLTLLPILKGMTVGLQWALFMHGFGGEDDTPTDRSDENFT